jgi:hypothetical protein
VPHRAPVRARRVALVGMGCGRSQRRASSYPFIPGRPMSTNAVSGSKKCSPERALQSHRAPRPLRAPRNAPARPWLYVELNDREHVGLSEPCARRSQVRDVARHRAGCAPLGSPIPQDHGLEELVGRGDRRHAFVLDQKNEKPRPLGAVRVSRRRRARRRPITISATVTKQLFMNWLPLVYLRRRNRLSWSASCRGQRPLRPRLSRRHHWHFSSHRILPPDMP